MDLDWGIKSHIQSGCIPVPDSNNNAVEAPELFMKDPASIDKLQTFVVFALPMQAIVIDPDSPAELTGSRFSGLTPLSTKLVSETDTTPEARRVTMVAWPVIAPSVVSSGDIFNTADDATAMLE